MGRKIAKPSDWEEFKTKPNPTAKVRELHAAMGDSGPGLNALYREWRERGTVMGVPVLEVAGRPYLPRQAVIAKLEGR